ncbi:MAG: antitoxin Xre-like helix-turn-helix domain-containing protein [Pseudomonadota bacterium]
MPQALSRQSAKPAAGVRKGAPSSNAATALLVNAEARKAKLWRELSRPGTMGFTDIFVMPFLDRADLVRHGAPSIMVNVISKEMEITKERFVHIVGLPRATVTRKIAKKANLSADESERLVGLAKLIGQVQASIEESGAPEGFKPAKWFGEWISQPLPALGGRRPEELLDTADGRELVSKLLAQMQSGAYA